MPPSPRLPLAFLLILFLAVGLPSRLLSPGSLPHWYVAYAGDATWAALVYCLFALCLPRLSPLKIAALSLAFAFLIELSQLYHAPWIDQIRAFKPAALVLGHSFLWTDLLAYTAGISIAFLINRFVIQGHAPKRSP